MSSNKDGLNGLDIEQIALEKVILVGVQAPNIKPAVRFEKNGKSLPTINVEASGGVQVETTSGYTCSPVDTSWINPLGIFNVVAGNKINLTAGTGGFEWVTAGPSKFNVAIQDFTCTHGFIVNTRLFSVGSTERTHFMGPRIDFEYNETYFTGRINFLSNVCMAGSLFVNGELYCTHMTTQKQQNITEAAEEITGFINPNAPYAVFNGKSAKSALYCGGFDSSLPISTPFEIPILFKVDLKKLIPGIGSILNLVTSIIEVPCIIKFTEGISLCSDCLAEANKTNPLFEKNYTEPRVSFIEDEKTDFYGPGHRHIYYGPAVNYKNSTADFYKESAEVMNSISPTPAKPCVPNGGNSILDVKDLLKEAVEKDFQKWLKKIGEQCVPKWLKDLTSSKK